VTEPARHSGQAAATPGAATRGERALDGFTFFCANLQTGFGPFVSVYLTASKWSQTDIGLVLMIGGLVGLIGQIPGGALVDGARSKPVVAGLAVAAIGVSALCVAVSSLFPVILFAWVCHAAASCLLSPCIAIISLDFVGHDGIGRRLGRNATFASIGSALAAAGMGAVGSAVSNKAVFLVTAALALPTILALAAIRRSVPAREPAPVATRRDEAMVDPKMAPSWTSVLGNRPLLILAIATALFYLGNAAILPLIGSVLTMRSARSPTVLIAACIIVPQIMVAVLSPMIGVKARVWGRRPLLAIGFAALPIRGICLGFIRDPNLFIAVQLLDGISAAALGVIVPLVAADVTRESGGYALAQGVVGTAMGLGASFSSTIAGFLTDHFGSGFAFLALGGEGAVALLVAVLFMPETKALGAGVARARQETPAHPPRGASRLSFRIGRDQGKP
jgi:MFS family permease